MWCRTFRYFIVCFVVTCFWVIVVKNGSCLLDHDSKIMIFYMLLQTDSGKLNVKLIIIGWLCSKTVLMSQNVICFRYFMPMSHGVNKKEVSTIVYLTPPSNQVFTGFVFCFTRNNFLPWSNRLLQKLMHFQSETTFLSTYCWSVLIVLFCVYVLHRALFHYK